MCEKKSLSQWLRNKEVYRAEGPLPANDRWREALLAGFEHAPAAEMPRTPEAHTPLQVRHLVLMAPAGLGLFGLGWLFGSGAVVMEQMARVSPVVWMACAVAGSAGFLAWRHLVAGGLR